MSISYVYGPVPSRRLGMSLGINIIPRKTCTCNCIYCQCGRTTRLTLTRRSFFPVREILQQVRTALKGKRVDYLTFSGEGEPTLNKDLGRLIRLLKEEFSIPVAVLTNSTLLFLPEVRRALYQADLVVPTLAAADQETFNRIHRPCGKLRIEKVIRGLETFRRFYRGRFWLEIMLVKGINDSPEHLMKLRRLAYRMKPDRVHLNTVVRPPAETWALSLTPDDLSQIKLLFGPEAEEVPAGIPARGAVAASPAEGAQPEFSREIQNSILAILESRPVTEDELTRCLGISIHNIKPVLGRLKKERKIKPVKFQGKVYYERE